MTQTVVSEFEDIVAKYTGAPYACAVDCCTNAIFLCLLYWRYILYPNLPVYKTEIPAKIKGKTIYRGVKRALELAGFEYSIADLDYDYLKVQYSILNQFSPIIIDAAYGFGENVYRAKSLTCLSFSYKKQFSIGRGGMILIDNKEAWTWFKDATMLGGMGKETSGWGWNMYLAPELAKIGIEKFKELTNE